MTITLDILPEMEQRLAQQAAVRGLEIDAYALSLLEDATRKDVSSTVSHPETKSFVELFAPLRGLNIDFEADRKSDFGRDIDL
ncbi:hypothetical protein SAMN05421770_103309 [Granulicella rosea]|uniref:Uncharacterized protein n=1 Tax=Granulicella rosea TaxID=474952 RepID=A0A239IWZ8_9BACT|nr:hypothetical protein [Granulicella rosea]SNS97748.1 hypothetical protein SAMN05421770_103309 [Granulicella rosea]